MTTYRAEDQEGHAVHFLKRLDRASGEPALPEVNQSNLDFLSDQHVFDVPREICAT
jgi:hypothetical protein